VVVIISMKIEQSKPHICLREEVRKEEVATRVDEQLQLVRSERDGWAEVDRLVDDCPRRWE